MRSSIQARCWWQYPGPVASQNHGSLAASNAASQPWPSGRPSTSASISSGVRSSRVNTSASWDSMASRASRRTSSSGRKNRMSIPATIWAMVWSAIPGKAWSQNPLNVRYAPYPRPSISKCR